MIEPVDRLTLFIDTLVALQRERDGGSGSPFGNLAGELADSHEGFRGGWTTCSTRWTEQLEALLGRPAVSCATESTPYGSRASSSPRSRGDVMTRVTRDVGVMEGIGEDLKRFIATHLRDGEARGLERTAVG